MNKVFGALALLAFALLVRCEGQTGPLGLGTIQVDDQTPTCTESGWISGTCRHATITCARESGISPLGLRFISQNPTTGPLGTIVFFNGRGGSPGHGPGPYKPGEPFDLAICRGLRGGGVPSGSDGLGRIL